MPAALTRQTSASVRRRAQGFGPGSCSLRASTGTPPRPPRLVGRHQPPRRGGCAALGNHVVPLCDAEVSQGLGVHNARRRNRHDGPAAALLHHRAVVARSGIVHQNIQPAEGLLNFGEQRIDAGLLAHVGAHHQRPPPQRAHRLCRFLGRSAVAEEVDDHVCAEAGEVQGNGSANAAPRPVMRAILESKIVACPSLGGDCHEGTKTVRHQVIFVSLILRALCYNSDWMGLSKAMSNSPMRSGPSASSAARTAAASCRRAATFTPRHWSGRGSSHWRARRKILMAPL